MDKKRHVVFEFPNIPPRSYVRKIREVARHGSHRSSESLHSGVVRSDSVKSMQASSPTTPPSHETKERPFRDDEHKPQFSPVTRFTLASESVTEYIPNKDVPYRRSKEEVKRILRERDKERARTLEISNPYSATQASGYFSNYCNRSQPHDNMVRNPENSKVIRSRTFQDASSTLKVDAEAIGSEYSEQICEVGVDMLSQTERGVKSIRRSGHYHSLERQNSGHCANRWQHQSGSKSEFVDDRTSVVSNKRGSKIASHLKPVSRSIQHNAPHILFNLRTYEERQQEK
ncbi:hypothetical protein FHG87_003627, partial [Trinorchestia longiramus]